MAGRADRQAPCGSRPQRPSHGPLGWPYPYAGDVPKRTNLFQEVVSIIHEHLADGSEIERSAMVPNRLTGELREVDVLLRSSTPPGYETVIGIEAASRSRRAAVDWVEEMIAKHKNLPTDKVVLVSERGFTEQARALAIAEKMVPITAEILEHEDPALQVINSLRSLWPKHISLTPEGARVWIDNPDVGVEVIQAPWSLRVFAEDGSSIELRHVTHALIEANWHRTIDQIELADIAEDVDAYAVIRVGPGWTVKLEGEQRSLYVERRLEGQTPELLRIDGMEVTAKAVIRVSEIPLHHRRLTEIDVDYAFGEGLIGDRQALVVVTEGGDGGKLSIQFHNRTEETVVGRTNFDHAPCYEQRLHPKTKQGRAWCRKHGPASKTR
jgi:hypothetical protein